METDASSATSPKEARSKTPTPSALAAINYGAIAEPDSSAPSEDESSESVAPYTSEDARGVIGVSIGHAQTRLTSPQTPAIEKAAALEDSDGENLFGTAWQPLSADEREESPDAQDQRASNTLPTDSTHATTPSNSTAQETQESGPRFPTPWRAEPRTFQRTDEAKSVLRDGFKGRRRTLSGSSAIDSFKKLLPNMPKSAHLLSFNIPGLSSPTSSSAANASRMMDGQASSKALSPAESTEQLQSAVSLRRRTGSGLGNNQLKRQSMFEPGALKSQEQHQSSSVTYSGNRTGPPRPPLRGQPSALRRSASYDSLVLYKSLSRASSLGDDTRFENVQQQINARFKAIKDSFQDSSFRLPSLPKTPTFNFPYLKGDSAMKPSSKASFSRHGSDRRPIGNPDDISQQSSKRGSTISLQQAAAQAGMHTSHASSHPIFTDAIKDLTGDVVVLGGYRGSVLREAKPPHRQLWAPIKIGLNLRDVNLEVGWKEGDDEKEVNRIVPDGMLKHIGPVDISRRLLKRLRHTENARSGKLRVSDWGYDWRLDPNLLSRQLIEYLEGLPCNKPGTAPEHRGAIVIAHSLGGLITRHAVNKRPELFAGVVFAGVPQTCVNILGPLRNGEDVLLSSKILTAQVNFSMRTSFALLPLDGRCFFNKQTKEEYPVDFFDIQTWIDNRLSPCIAPPLPPLNPTPPNSGLSGILNSMSNALPSLQSMSRRASQSMSRGSNSSDAMSRLRAEAETSTGNPSRNFEPQMSSKNDSNPALYKQPLSDSPLTNVTISQKDAIAYLSRILPQVKAFKEALAHDPNHQSQNLYPPFAVIYGKSTPTCNGAKVTDRDEIRRATAYDELAFGSGDGVVLARAAMLPIGYTAVKGGVISSERGHIGLLGDLEAVGKTLRVIMRARKRGVGMGLASSEGLAKEYVDPQTLHEV